MKSLPMVCIALAVALSAPAAPAPKIVIADSGSLKVFVIGAVRNAGKRELENGTKVWEAIEQAGGFEQGISQSAVRLVRQGPEGKVSTVSLDLSGKEKSTDNVELRDKDVVFVPRRNP